MAKATKKTTTKKATTKKTTAKNAPAKKVSKSKKELAVAIMERFMPKYWEGEMSRAAILKEMQEKAGLTKAGSATYFQNIKNQMLEDELN